MNRRSFMQAILATAVAPAVVRAAHLMPVRTLLPEPLFLGTLGRYANMVWRVPAGAESVLVTAYAAAGGGGRLANPIRIREHRFLASDIGNPITITFG